MRTARAENRSRRKRSARARRAVARRSEGTTHAIHSDENAEVVRALLREFRIFTAANALIFLLLGATTYWRRTAGLQLLLPAVVLVGSATLVGAFYLFAQDWLHTILFSDYVGLGYFAYVGMEAVCLADIVFNRARVTTEVVMQHSMSSARRFKPFHVEKGR